MFDFIIGASPAVAVLAGIWAWNQRRDRIEQERILGILDEARREMFPIIEAIEESEDQKIKEEWDREFLAGNPNLSVEERKQLEHRKPPAPGMIIRGNFRQIHQPGLSELFAMEHMNDQMQRQMRARSFDMFGDYGAQQQMMSQEQLNRQAEQMSNQSADLKVIYGLLNQQGDSGTTPK